MADLFKVAQSLHNILAKKGFRDRLTTINDGIIARVYVLKNTYIVVSVGPSQVHFNVRDSLKSYYYNGYFYYSNTRVAPYAHRESWLKTIRKEVNKL